MQSRQQLRISLTFVAILYSCFFSLFAQCPISFVSSNQGVINVVLGVNCAATFDASTRISIQGNCNLLYYRDFALTLPYSGLPSFSGANLGQTIEVYVTADDGNTNTPLTTPLKFTLKIIDAVAPTISCPVNQSFTASGVACSYVITNGLTALATDNCNGSVALTWSITGKTTNSGSGTLNGKSFNVGRSIVTYNATDASSNMMSCSFSVDVNETVAPTLVNCPQNVSFDAPMGTCERIVVSGLTPSFSDNCSDAANISFAYELSGVTTKSSVGSANNSLFKVGTTLVKYIASDVFGNTNSACTFNVTIKDIDIPQVLCPVDLSLNTSSDFCYASISSTNLTPLRLDNCGQNNLATTFSLSGATQTSEMPLQDIANQQFAKGVTTVVYTVTDAAGNSNSCAQRITISDKTLPKISCNSSHINTTTELSECQKQVTLPQPLVSDNCTSPANISITYTLKGGVNSAGTGLISPNQLFVPGMTTVTYRATDESGNFSECSYNVTVIEVPLVKPTLECRTDTTLIADSGKCIKLISNGLQPKKASDNCSALSSLSLKVSFSGATILADTIVPVIQGANGFVFNLGKTKVRYILSDASSNSDTCYFNVDVLDKQRPVITCGTDVTMTATNGCSQKVTGLTPSATDNCGNGSLKFSYTLLGATPNPQQTQSIDLVDFSVGITTVKFIVQDQAQNIDSCQFDVTILENIAPQIVCPNNLTVNTTDSTCTAFLQNIPNPTLSDNCSQIADLKWFYATSGASSITGNQSINGRFLNRGKTIVTYAVSDFSGNTAQCSFSIQVKDATPPTIICPSNITVNAYDTTCYAIVSSPSVTFKDNCSANLLYEISGATSKNGAGLFANELLNIGKNVVKFTAKDNDSNTNQCTFEIFVKDNIAPKISCPSDLTLLVSDTNCSAIAPAQNPMMKDNCTQLDLTYNVSGATSLINQQGVLTAKNFNFGKSIVTYQVADIQTNTATCSFNVFVQDAIKPVAKCRTGMMIALDMSGNAYMPSVMFDNGSTDNCTASNQLVFSASKEYFDCSNLVNNSVLLTVKDISGNTATCSSTLTVKNAFSNLNISLSTSSINESYWGATDGSVAVTVSGGQGKFDYLWSNGAAEASQSDLATGVYTVTVYDKVSRCSATASAKVEAGPQMAISVGNIIGVSGATALVPIRVQNFNKINQLQFSLRLLNPSVGIIEGVQDFGVSNDSLTYSATSTLVAFRKTFPNVGGMTLPNGTALFFIRIKLTAPIGTYSNLVFHSIPNVMEVKQFLPSGLTKIPINGVTGSVGVGNGNATAKIGGKIIREDNVSLSNVSVYLTGTYKDSSTTKLDGKFEYDLPLGAKITLRASRNDEVRKGLTAIDAMLIQRHILGYENLSSDYKKLAADVNNSGNITALDVSEVKRVILGYLPTFRNTNVWRFLPSDYVFPVQTQNQVLPFSDSLLVAYLLDNQKDRNFIAIKTGDVNLSANANFSGSAGGRNENQLSFEIEEKPVNTGEIFEITLKNTSDLNIAALQTALKFDPSVMEFQAFGQTQLSNFELTDLNKTQSGVGELRFVWLKSEPQKIIENTPILTLQFRAKKAIQSFKNYFSIDSKVMPSVAFEDGIEKEVALIFKSQIVENEDFVENELCYPNPANDILFIPAKAAETISLIDAQGKILSKTVANTSQLLRIETADFLSGLYLLKIESEGETKVQNVLILH